MTKTEIGPIVWCEETNDIAHTHRYGNKDPWFCFKCGATDHKDAS